MDIGEGRLSGVRLPHPCGWPGCAALIVGTRLCPEHQAVDRRCNEVSPHPRDVGRTPRPEPKGQQSAEYQRSRASMLERYRSCAWCGARRELEVDHIVRVRDGGGHGFDNLRVLCKSCHLMRHRADERRRRTQETKRVPQPGSGKGAN